MSHARLDNALRTLNSLPPEAQGYTHPEVLREYEYDWMARPLMALVRCLVGVPQSVPPTCDPFTGIARTLHQTAFDAVCAEVMSDPDAERSAGVTELLDKLVNLVHQVHQLPSDRRARLITSFREEVTPLLPRERVDYFALLRDQDPSPVTTRPTVSASDESQCQLDPNERLVLEALRKNYPNSMKNREIQKDIKRCKQLVGKTVTKLTNRQLVMRRHGQKMGVSLTEKGIVLLTQLEA